MLIPPSGLLFYCVQVSKLPTNSYFFEFFYVVPPLSVRLMGDRKKPLVANKESLMECRCYGSRPTPAFRWFVGDRELDVADPEKMTVEHHQATSSTGECSYEVCRSLYVYHGRGRKIF